MKTSRATAIGFTAVLMWALLALFTIGSAPVPPFLLNALTFAIGGTLGLIWTLRGGLGRLRGISWRVYAFGIIGLFGYHALYFTAFRIAPSAETGLMAYLWPLFIVLFASFLPGERLRPIVLIGAVVAFAGAALIVLGRDAGGNATPLGLFLGFLCAITWAGYSTLSRRLGDVPTESVTVFCLGTAVLSALAHLAWEETVWPATGIGWLSILALGIGPVGAAFFTWDIGMKQGDIQLLGVASYAAPLLSTLALVATGITPASWTLLAAAVLITGGAALAARASAGAGASAGE
ncbi:aromatic amino acid exporter YddG [Paragemmobacter ruber]|uniref:EamA family transporter n=1 Tax=Paragemmobacter ruber TaxID=1985673 RepID=A0ABW9Y3C6_9RHOB|nr:DMT family transporter [Rhodobacter ruber]NBE07007.1 EamA family transporter [Rhodobacter ruber]